MSHFVSLKRAMCAHRGVLLAGLLCASAASAAAPVLGPTLKAQPAPASSAVPDFMAPGTGWTMINSNATDYVDPPSGPKPVTNDPKYPHIGNLQPGQKTERVADLTNPILQDWLKPQMQKYNQEVIDGDHTLRSDLALLARRRAGAIAGADDRLFHPEAGRSRDDLGTRPARCGMSILTSSTPKSAPDLVRRVRRPLREWRHAGHRHHRFCRTSLQLRRQLPHAPYQAAPRHRALEDHDCRRGRTPRRRPGGRKQGHRGHFYRR